MPTPSLPRLSLALAGVAVAVYLNTLHAQFTFDDNFAVITNGDVADPNKPLKALFTNDFWGQDLKSEMSHKSYRPLTVLSFRLQRIVGQALFGASRAQYVKQLEAAGKHDNSRGLDPRVFHFSNVLAHAAVTVLVFRLALRLIASRRRQFDRKVAWSVMDLGEAFVGALLFAVHPIHTEAVAGIVGHAEMLCAALSILGLLSYMAAADGRAPSLASHWCHVALAVAFSWASALTKEIGITIMGAMACYDLLVAPLTITFPSQTPSPVKASSAMRMRKGAGSFSSPGNRARSVAAAQSPSAAKAAGGGSSNNGKGDGSTPTIPTAAGAATQAADGGGTAPAGGTAAAAAVVRRGGRRGLRLKLLRVAVVMTAVVMYVKARSVLAGDQLVRIYRKVENPIPFSDSSLERKLTTGYLHARYFELLLAPVHLSADWSYACIDYVSNLKDPRNAATAGLYLLLVVIALAAAPWRVLAQWAGKLPEEPTPGEQARRWRLAVLTGLLVAPYFPASNVLFYVGTFIGERLMYFPSVGFCLLAAELLAPPLLPLFQRVADEGWRGVKRGRLGFKATAMGLLLAVVVVLFTAKTLHRNTEWYDEELLFRAAQKVCGRSAKVQLNSGILERRYQEWDKAAEHFREAQRIDPTFCEPDYHIGVTLLSQGQRWLEALDYLEKGVKCKYTAAEATKALNQVFAALTQSSGGGAGSAQAAAVGTRWAKVLALPELRRYSEALHYCEQAAMLHARAGNEPQAWALLKECSNMLEDAEPCLEGRTMDYPIRVSAPPELLATLQTCHQARTPVFMAIARAPRDQGDDPLNAASVRSAAYRYFTQAGGECRQPLPSMAGDPELPEQQQQRPSFHMELVHMLQTVDPSDPWVQMEWSETMLAAGRATDALVHTEVAGQLLKQVLKGLLAGQKSRWLGKDGSPMTVEAARDGALAAYQRGLAVAKNPKVARAMVNQHGQAIRVGCIMQVEMCEVFDVLSRAPASAGLRAYAGDLQRCLQEATRMDCPLGGRTFGAQQAQQAAAGAAQGRRAARGGGAGAAAGRQRHDYDEEEEEGHGDEL